MSLKMTLQHVHFYILGKESWISAIPKCSTLIYTFIVYKVGTGKRLSEHRYVFILFLDENFPQCMYATWLSPVDKLTLGDKFIYINHEILIITSYWWDVQVSCQLHDVQEAPSFNNLRKISKTKADLHLSGAFIACVGLCIDYYGRTISSFIVKFHEERSSVTFRRLL